MRLGSRSFPVAVCGEWLGEGWAHGDTRRGLCCGFRSAEDNGKLVVGRY